MTNPQEWCKILDTLRDADKPRRHQIRERAWNPRHHTYGFCDSGNPRMRRRYFDEVCNEPSTSKPDHLWEFDSEVGDQRTARGRSESTASHERRTPVQLHVTYVHSKPFVCVEKVGDEKKEERRKPERRKPWVDAFWMDCSTDNPIINPLLRHYFDRRGMESSYRTRPLVDKHAPVLPPHSPREPYPQHSQQAKKGLKEEPNIHWGNRVLKYGSNVKVQTLDERIPWVADHTVTETTDNYGLHPKLRHYFDREGLPASFKSRGRHFGRTFSDPFKGTMVNAPRLRETFSRTMSSVSLPTGSGPILLGGETAAWGRGAGEVLAPSDPQAPGHNQLEAPAGATALWDDRWWWGGPGRRKPYSHGPAASQQLLSESVSYPSLLQRPHPFRLEDN